MIKTIIVVAFAIVTSVAWANDSENSIEEILVVGKELLRKGSRLNLTIKEIPATVDKIEGDAIRLRRDSHYLRRSLEVQDLPVQVIRETR